MPSGYTGEAVYCSRVIKPTTSSVVAVVYTFTIVILGGSAIERGLSISPVDRTPAPSSTNNAQDGTTRQWAFPVSILPVVRP